MVNWSTEDVEKWMTEARNIQQELLEHLGDREWDCIKKENRWALEMKVGFALCGEPKLMPSKTNKFGYKADQFKEIGKICDLIYKKSGKSKDIHIAFIFAVGKMHERQMCCPIFRIKRESMKVVFLDHIGRVYKNWKDYCKNNKYPKCLLCYPENGIYKATPLGLVKLTYDTSPACKLPSKATRVLDKVSLGVGLGTAAVAVTSIFVPVVAPIMVAAVIGGTSLGAYGAARGSYQLYERSAHSQSIGLKNSEARNSWLTILGGAFGIGSSIAVTSVAKIVASGSVLGTTGQCVVNFLNFGSLTVSGLGVVNGVAVMVEKYERNELTALDVVQWSASLFFFFNALINVKTANTMIREVQEGMKSDFTKDLSKRRREAFKRVEKQSSGQGVIQENSQINKGISNIGSKDEFFRLVIKAQKLDKATTKLTQSGKIEVGGQLFVDTRAGVSHPINYGQNSKNFSWSSSDTKCALEVAYETLVLVKNIHKEIKRIKISERVQFTMEGELLDGFCDRICIYFSSSNGYMMEQGGYSCLITEAENFARDRGCTTEKDFIGFSEFLCIYKRNKLKQMERSYQEEKSGLISQIGDDFDEAEFDKKWKIEDSSDREGSFLRAISEELKRSNENLKREYDTYNRDVELLNQSGKVKFSSKFRALNQFYRCFVIDLDETLTPEEYFRIIRNTVQDEQFKVGTEDVGEDRTFLLYYDPDVPVIVKLLKNRDGLFFESTVFQRLEDLENKL